MKAYPDRGHARVPRGVVATTVCALLTYAGHGAAGGACPDPRLLVVAALPLAGVLVALAGRRRGPMTVLGLVGGSQLLMHGMLQLLGDAPVGTLAASSLQPMLGLHSMPDTTAMPGMTAMPGLHSMPGMASMPGGSFGGGPGDLAGLAGMSSVWGGHPLLMLLAHGLVTLVTAGLLSGAEDAVFTVVALLARVLPRLIAPPRPSSRPARAIPAPTEPRDARPREALGRRLHPRRGPPPAVPAGAH